MTDHAFKITVTRKSQLMDSHVPMQIVINGCQAGILKNGQSATYDISGHNAEIQAYLSMNKTPLFSINASGVLHKKLLVESSMTNLIFIIGTVMVVISTIMVLYTNQLLYMLIAAPPALYHLYLRFVRKDKYLVIREQTEIADDKKGKRGYSHEYN
jgi:hypothetical protein